jgi:nucleoid-associated protein YejK
MIFKKNRQDGSFHINALEHLDLNKLALACRIDLDDYQKAEGRYISFMSKQGDVSAYFTQWVGARSVGSDRVLTEDFNRLIERVPLPIREDGTEMTRAEFKQQVYRHVQNHPNKAIDLQLIGQTFYDDSQFLVTQADAGDFAISTHFKANRPALSRLIWGTVDYSRLSDLLGKLETKGQLTYRIHENRERVTFESPELVELLEAIRRGD